MKLMVLLAIEKSKVRSDESYHPGFPHSLVQNFSSFFLNCCKLHDSTNSNHYTCPHFHCKASNTVRVRPFFLPWSIYQPAQRLSLSYSLQHTLHRLAHDDLQMARRNIRTPYVAQTEHIHVICQKHGNPLWPINDLPPEERSICDLLWICLQKKDWLIMTYWWSARI